MMTAACPLDCLLCPARVRCGGMRNFCGTGWPNQDGTCSRGQDHPLLQMDARDEIVRHLGGLGLDWPRQSHIPPSGEVPRS